MGRLGFDFQLCLTFSEQVTHHAFALRCLPLSDGSQQLLAASVHVAPECRTSWIIDAFGGKLTAFVPHPHTELLVRAEGNVVCQDAVTQAPPACQLGPYCHATPLTMPGPALSALAKSLPAQSTAQAAMALLQERFRYLPGSTSVHTTAEEAARTMQGVCQDEAHMMLALLRLRGIPCRYVMGYMLGEGLTHGWVEVAQDGQWIGLDPTNHRRVNDEYIRIGVGRDANDCPVNRGVFRASVQQTSESSLRVWRMDDTEEKHDD